jgi:hypothetical protein
MHQLPAYLRQRAKRMFDAGARRSDAAVEPLLRIWVPWVAWTRRCIWTR